MLKTFAKVKVFGMATKEAPASLDVIYVRVPPDVRKILNMLRAEVGKSQGQFITEMILERWKRRPHRK